MFSNMSFYLPSIVLFVILHHEKAIKRSLKKKQKYETRRYKKGNY